MIKFCTMQIKLYANEKKETYKYTYKQTAKPNLLITVTETGF